MIAFRGRARTPCQGKRRTPEQIERHRKNSLAAYHRRKREQAEELDRRRAELAIDGLTVCVRGHESRPIGEPCPECAERKKSARPQSLTAWEATYTEQLLALHVLWENAGPIDKPIIRRRMDYMQAEWARKQQEHGR